MLWDTHMHSQFSGDSHTPQQITGYEYQVYASLEAIEKGWLESPYMPHAETLRIMQDRKSVV